jgi:hypothetical protein
MVLDLPSINRIVNISFSVLACVSVSAYYKSEVKQKNQGGNKP